MPLAEAPRPAQLRSRAPRVAWLASAQPELVLSCPCGGRLGQRFCARP
jgi:hypothetical protein